MASEKGEERLIDISERGGEEGCWTMDTAERPEIWLINISDWRI